MLRKVIVGLFKMWMHAYLIVFIMDRKAQIVIQSLVKMDDMRWVKFSLGPKLAWLSVSFARYRLENKCWRFGVLLWAFDCNIVNFYAIHRARLFRWLWFFDVVNACVMNCANVSVLLNIQPNVDIFLIYFTVRKPWSHQRSVFFVFFLRSFVFGLILMFKFGHVKKFVSLFSCFFVNGFLVEYFWENVVAFSL